MSTYIDMVRKALTASILDSAQDSRESFLSDGKVHEVWYEPTQIDFEGMIDVQHLVNDIVRVLQKEEVL